MNKPKRNKSNKPTSQQIMLHFAVLIGGIVLLAYICFAQQLPGGFVLTLQGKTVAVVVVILVIGGYLRRFGRRGKQN